MTHTYKLLLRGKLLTTSMVLPHSGCVLHNYMKPERSNCRTAVKQSRAESSPCLRSLEEPRHKACQEIKHQVITWSLGEVAEWSVCKSFPLARESKVSKRVWPDTCHNQYLTCFQEVRKGVCFNPVHRRAEGSIHLRTFRESEGCWKGEKILAVLHHYYRQANS